MAMPARLLDGQLQQVQRPSDVDVVGGLGDELRPRGEDRGEMVDRMDLELAAEALEEVAIADVAREADRAPTRQLGVERTHVERHDVDGSALGESVDQAVCHLPARPGDQYHGPACHVVSPLRALALRHRSVGLVSTARHRPPSPPRGLIRRRPRHRTGAARERL